MPSLELFDVHLHCSLETMASAGGADEVAFSNPDLALAQMSKLQRKQLDKDGDGQFSAAELAASGFSGVGATSGPPLAKPQEPMNVMTKAVMRPAPARNVYVSRKDSPVTFVYSAKPGEAPPAGMGPFSVNAFCTRRPDLFTGRGASAATPQIPQGGLPRSRDKPSALSQLDKNTPPPPPPPKPEVKRMEELQTKQMSENQTMVMHPVLGPVVVNRPRPE